MSYSAVDLVLHDWTSRKGLRIYKLYKDTEVRSIEIVSPQGKRFQLWIDEPSQTGDIGIHIWDMKKKRKDYSASSASFENVLEEAYKQAQSWF